jgi:CelD/BcsL family acetyltransferase involved in cellulose biosynthesis
MQVTTVCNRQEVSTVLSAWEAWTDTRPMQTPAWSLSWWDNFATEVPGVTRELFLVVVSDALGSPRGLLPLYRESAAVRTSFTLPVRTLRLLGDGSVCSDHLTLLCDPGFEPLVVDALAEWLIKTGNASEWDVMQLEGVDADDPALRLLVQRLRDGGCWLDQRPDQSTWSLKLPACWEGYLASLSKNHRKRCRRWWKTYFETERAIHREVRSVDELPRGLETLYRLHDSRRAELGDAGVFQGAFQRFHATLLPKYVADGRARICGAPSSDRASRHTSPHA